MKSTISVHFSLLSCLERLIPARIGRLLGWSTCFRCLHADRSVTITTEKTRELMCTRCWVKYVYFPEFQAKEEDLM